MREVVKGDHADEEQQHQVHRVGEGVFAALHVLRDARVGDPDAADEGEADVVAEELGHCSRSLGSGRDARKRGDFDLERQQRDRNREDAVGEGAEAV